MTLTNLQVVHAVEKTMDVCRSDPSAEWCTEHEADWDYADTHCEAVGRAVHDALTTLGHLGIHVEDATTNGRMRRYVPSTDCTCDGCEAARKPVG